MVILGNKELSINLDIAKRRISTRKGFLVGVLAATGLILAACGFSPKTETPINTSQPEFTESIPANGTPAIGTPFVEVSPIFETTPTQERPIPAEEKKIFLSEKIEYGGRTIDFEISALTSDTIMMDTFDKFGIEDISINEDNPGSREIIGKMIAFSFQSTYNFQNNVNVGFEEYVLHPEDFPVTVMVRNEGKVVEQTMTMDMITSYEMRYTTGMKGELFYTFPGMISDSIGYSFDNGHFIYYQLLSPGDPGIKRIIEMPIENRSHDLSFVLGEYAVFQQFEKGISLMKYSVFTIKDNKTIYDLQDPNVILQDEIINLLNFESVKGMNWDQYVEFLKKHIPFVVIVK